MTTTATKYTPHDFAQKVKAGRGWLIVRNSATLADTDYEHVADQIVAALNGAAERDRLRAENAELREALRNAERDLWHALGGDDDKANAERANRVCAPYRAALAKAKGAA